MSTDLSRVEGACPRRWRTVVHALGCKVSRIDALAAGELLSRAPIAGEAAEGDVLLVHTCTVTDRADRDGRRLIRSLRRQSPKALLVVTGCLAQRDPDALARMPEVDLVVGHGAKADLPAILRAREAGLLPGKVVWSASDAFPSIFAAPSGLNVQLDPDRTRAFVKIQDGCERRCTFCVVPSVRGAERSAPPDDVEAEIRRLAEAGTPEVVLAGVHLANYGKEIGTSLVALVRRLENDPPRCRVRLSSLEPMEAGEELLELVAASRVVAPYLHLPLQSGSDAVLRRMRRGITAAGFLRLASRVCALAPRLHLATDLIAGFPGETETEFEETRRLVAALPLASAHVFPFSPRSGTPAARLHALSGVPPRVVTARAAALRKLAEEKHRAFCERQAGSLAEIVSLRGGRGLTDNYVEVRLQREGQPPGTPPAPGRRFQGRLVLDRDGSLIAEPVDSPAPSE